MSARRTRKTSPPQRSTVPRAAPQLRDWHAIALLGAAVAFFFRDIITQRAFFWEDFLVQAYPFRNFASVSLANGELPLWNPYTFAGMPFQADIQSAVFYLPNLFLVPFVSDGHLPFHVFELSLVAHYWIAGATMYYLAKEFGLEPVYALFSGLLFALSGFLIVQAIHPAFVQQLAWFPLIMLLFHRALLRKSVAYTLWAGLAVGLSLLAGAPQMTLFLFLLLAFYAGFLFLSGERSGNALKGKVHMLWMPALLVIVSFAVGAIQLLPTIELQPLSQRASLTFEQAQFGRLGFQQFLTAIVPRLFGSLNAAGRSYWGPGEYGTFWETCFYLGIPGAFAIFFALPLLRTVPFVRFLFGVAVFAFLLALGNNFFLHRLFFEFVPGFGTFRGIGRATVLATFSGSLLGGMGLRALVDLAGRNASRAQISLACGAGLVALLWLLIRYHVLFPNNPHFEASLHETTVALGFAVLFTTAGILLARRMLKPALALASLLLIQFADVHTFGFAQNNSDLSGTGYFQKDAEEPLRVLKEDGRDELFRMSARMGNEQVLDRNFGMIERIFLVEGYTPLRLSRVEPPASSPGKVHDLLNVKYRPVMLPDGTGGLTAVRSYLPRAFVVHDVTLAPTEAEVNTIMKDAAFDAARTVVLESPLDMTVEPANPAITERVEVTSYGINNIKLDVQLGSNAVLVLSEIFYPGWTATIDGVAAPVVRADWSLRAVPVAAGSHVVELSFRPATFALGAAISGVTLIILLVSLGLSAWLQVRTPQPGRQK